MCNLAALAAVADCHRCQGQSHSPTAQHGSADAQHCELSGHEGWGSGGDGHRRDIRDLSLPLTLQSCAFVCHALYSSKGRVGGDRQTF